MERMTIGQLAAAGGVNVETVRYYQRRGLLPAAERTPGSIARYPRQALARLRFIRRTQALGFNLEDVRALLSLQDGGGCAQARGLGERKLAEVRRRIQELQAMEQSLQALVALCSGSPPEDPCPLIEQLKQAA